MIELIDDDHCFACGRENPIGLGLTFALDGGVLSASFTPEKKHQGYRGVVHGGIIATILDECMAQAAIKTLGAMAATAEMSVRFRTALRVGQEVVATASVRKDTRRLAHAQAELRRASDGVLIAEAESKLLKG